MIAADGLVALTSMVLGVVFWVTATPPVWFIYLILFLRGIGNTFHSPAIQAAIPMLVPAEMLTKAGGWGNLINSLSNMFGPVLGAAFIAAFPIASIMLVDKFGALFAIFYLLFVSIPDIPQNEEKPHLLSDMRQGFSAMRGNKPLMAIFPRPCGHDGSLYAVGPFVCRACERTYRGEPMVLLVGARSCGNRFDLPHYDPPI
jgi:DHA3 family macrolide efflux protein-like MFS transporter